MALHCLSALILPTKDRVPCTRDYDHLEQHALIVFGVLILQWGTTDEGTGRVTGGILSPAFPDGLWCEAEPDDA